MSLRLMIARPPVSSAIRLSMDCRLFFSRNVSTRCDVVRFSAVTFESTVRPAASIVYIETPDAFAAWMMPR